MFENFGNFLKKMVKQDNKELGSKDDAKERLHLVLMQDRANVSADFLELMKQEIIDVIKKYIIVDEAAIDVRLTNKTNDDGTTGAPALYANIPIVNIKNDMKAEKINEIKEIEKNRLEKEKKVSDSSEENPNEDSTNMEVQKNEKINEEVLAQIPNETEEVSNVKENQIEKEKVIEKSKNSNGAKVKKKDKDHASSNKHNTKTDDSDESDDGNDVTFDELLKVAEEDLKNSEEQKKGE